MSAYIDLEARKRREIIKRLATKACMRGGENVCSSRSDGREIRRCIENPRRFGAIRDELLPGRFLMKYTTVEERELLKNATPEDWNSVLLLWDPVAARWSE